MTPPPRDPATRAFLDALAEAVAQRLASEIRAGRVTPAHAERRVERVLARESRRGGAG